jgi:hypothetical protein
VESEVSYQTTENDLPGINLFVVFATMKNPLEFGLSHCLRQMSPLLSRRERSKQQKVELTGGNVIREFCLNSDFYVTFRDLLHAQNLRHGPDGFTSPPKEGGLGIFRPQKS